jgi:hypothetical protein
MFDTFLSLNIMSITFLSLNIMLITSQSECVHHSFVSVQLLVCLNHVTASSH